MNVKKWKKKRFFNKKNNHVNHKNKSKKDELINNRYLINKKIDEGSYGRVFLAQDTREEKGVVLKYIEAKYYYDQIKEIHFMRALYKQYPKYFVNISDVFYNKNKDDIIVVMDFYPWTLSDLMEHDLENKYLLNILQQLIEAIVIMEQNFICHYDIKPENIMIDWDPDSDVPTIKMIDFGFSEYYSTEERSTLISTDYYRAPELFKHTELDYGIEIDLWSVGIVLAEYFVNKHVFRGEDDAAILNAIETELEDLPYDDYYQFHPDLGYVISHFLSKDPNVRLEGYHFIRHHVVNNMVNNNEIEKPDSTVRLLYHLPDISKIDQDYRRLYHGKKTLQYVDRTKWNKLLTGAYKVFESFECDYVLPVAWSGFYYSLINWLENTNAKVDYRTLYVNGVSIMYFISYIYYIRPLDLRGFLDICKDCLGIGIKPEFVRQNKYKLMKYI